MRRLVAHQAVDLELDGDSDAVASIDCRLQSVHGPVAALAPVDDVAPRLQERLAPGSLSFMTFNYRAAAIALRGVALAVPTREALEFVVIDGIQVAERRSAGRVPLLTPIRALTTDADGAVIAAVATVTVDLSMGGAMLTRRPNLGDGPRWQIELTLPGDADPVRCNAVLARDTPTHFGVRFEDMQEADQLRLAAVLANHQRRMATPLPATL